jgi:hypothetical protein
MQNIARDGWTVLRIAFRAAIWKSSPQERFDGSFGHLLAWCGALVAIWLVADFLRAHGDPSAFSPYGLNARVAWLAVSLTLAALFVRPDRRLSYLTISTALSVVLEVIFGSALALATPYLSDFAGDSWWLGMANWFGVLMLYDVWWVGAVSKILDSVQPDRAPQWRRAMVMWVALLAALAAVPHYPVFVGRDFNSYGANAWEYTRAALTPSKPEPEPRPRIDIAEAELAQPALVAAMTATLEPERPGRTDVYAIGVAGWAPQNVFLKELKAALDIVDKTLPIKGRSALLINNADTVADIPIANRQNFAAVVHAVAQRMNKDEDVLFLFMTSHGSPRGVALLLPGSVNTTLSPADVVAVLEREGIKNRIVVVSSCYAGVFIKPLANVDTIVLTAADETNTSFGCSDDRDWTYFGEALFARSLTPGKPLDAAFVEAKTLIGEWEAEQKITPSNPQAHFGARLLERLSSVQHARAAQLGESGTRTNGAAKP